MRYSLAAFLVLATACSSGSPSPTPPSAPPPTGQASADLRLNAQKSGTFNCTGGLFFVTSVLNQTNAPLRVDTLTLTYTKVSGAGCVNHNAPIDPAVGVSVPPGLSTEIRRVDLAGDLCAAPNGSQGCEWLGKATVVTSFGTLTDEMGFRTAAVAAPDPGPPTSCGTDHPVVVTPAAGATLSGIVGVSALLASDNFCPITLRSYVQASRVGGGEGGFAVFLELETYRWNTTSSPNGRYRITAQKACGTRLCGGISDPFEVTVDNR